MVSQLKYGQVRARIAVATLDDNTEPDPEVIPEITAIAGARIVFWASISRLSIVDSQATDSNGITILDLPDVHCITDAQGYLIDPITGARGVTLIAPDTAYYPDPWTWTVRITPNPDPTQNPQSAQFPANSQPPVKAIASPPHYQKSFVLTEAGVNLANVVAVPPSPGTALADWAAAVAAVQAIADQIASGGGAGGSGSGPAFAWTPPTPQSTWTIPHTLGRLPVVQVYVGGEAVSVGYTASDTQVIIQWPSPTTGTAVIS